MIAVAWTLIEFGRMLDRSAEKPIGQAQSIAMLCYLSAFVVMLLVGLAQPTGPLGFPAINSLVGVLGGMSPLLWMMQWFRADMFKLRGAKPLEIDKSISSIVLAIVMVLLAVAVTLLGQNQG
ncbi:MAG: hypothetical protein CMJ78_14115 [Planctomycetaceae bacterium]|nr:hypothetical protein [Planctomycetaceae bacterium]